MLHQQAVLQSRYVDNNAQRGLYGNLVFCHSRHATKSLITSYALHLVKLEWHQDAQGPNDPERAVNEEEELSPPLPRATGCP